MDFRKFALFLIVVSLVGLTWSYGAYSSTLANSFAAKKFYAQEHEEQGQALFARVGSLYTNQEAIRKGQEIAEAQATRRESGKTGMMIFGALALLAVGIRFSARPAPDRSQVQPDANGLPGLGDQP